MRCGACQRENRQGARFCRGCGAALPNPCPDCGAPTEPDSAFCDRCGARLASAVRSEIGPRAAGPASYTPRHLAERILSTRAALEGERKHVTVLFADVVGSTEIAGHLEARVVGASVAKRVGEGEDPLADGHFGQDAIDEMRGGVGHAPAAARGTETTPLAREGDEAIVAAGVAVEPQKTVSKDPAPEVRAQLLLDEARRRAIAFACAREEGLEQEAHAHGEEARHSRVSRRLLELEVWAPCCA